MNFVLERWSVALCGALLVTLAQGQGSHQVHGLVSAGGGPASTDASARVVPFDLTVWSRLLKSSPRPAAYMFTTSYCATCVDAFEQVVSATQGRQAELAVVMMDVTGRQAQAHARHFKGMTRLYAFDGREDLIRQGIDPQWPLVTPYFVLINGKGERQHVLGPPSVQQVAAWLRR